MNGHLEMREMEEAGVSPRQVPAAFDTIDLVLVRGRVVERAELSATKPR
ncbi:MAG: hypothetical protein ACT4P6_03470 [Gemmatimonadaceae bacterium]